MDQEQVDLPVAQFVRDSVKLALLQVARRNAQCISTRSLPITNAHFRARSAPYFAR